MNKKALIIIIVIFFISLLLMIEKNTYAANTVSTKKFTREEMQDFVVSTGLSYLYNNIRSDYEQKTMDSKTTFNWRTFAQSPEMVNRGSKFFIDCSSFVASVYIHSLGYDFSEHYKQSESYAYWPTANKTNSKGKIAAKASKTNFNIAYQYIGKGINTVFFANIGAQAYNDDDGSHINKYKEYIDSSLTKNKIVAYYYAVTGTEEANEKTSVKDHLTGSNKILKPGDLIIYRRGAADSGHVILYIGDEFDSEGGFVHAGGKDYVFPSDTEEINYGMDDYSVKYDNLDLLINNVFSTGTSTEGSSFTVLRPINNFCDNNDCEIATCDKSSCGIGYLNNNVKARVDLNELRVEQYAKIEKEYNDNLSSSTGTRTISKSFSQYNSVNMGDDITYNIYLVNKSKMSYCTSGKYDNETDCTEDPDEGYEWRQKSTTGRIYNNLTITSKIPDNTIFVGCNRDCTCDVEPCSEKATEVTWIINEKNPLTTERTYRYTVKVKSGDAVTNEGIKIITENNNTLQFNPIKTKVNPTFNGINIDLMKDEVEKFKTLQETGKITYKSNDYSAYKEDLDTITSSFSISQFGFIKMIYYNTLGIDIGYIKSSNIIRDSIFNNDTIDDGHYIKKTDDEVNLLTDTIKININKMLVKGMYGGRLLKGNENLDRAKYLRPADLEVGDILVFFYNDATSISTSMFYGLDTNGNSIFIRFESDGGITTYDINNKTKNGISFLKDMYAKDLFVVLRPTQLYGTTVNYEYNDATTKGDTSYVAYNTYQNLTTPSKEDKTVTLDYNQETIPNKSYTGTNTFDGWYSDSNLTNEITNSTKLISTDAHTIYAKWNSRVITLPDSTKINGYRIEGWYSDAEFSKKVANTGEEYEITENITLYAKWEKLITITSDTITVDINNKILSNITLNTTFNNLINQLTINTSNIKFLDNYKNELNKDTKIKTGYIIKLDDNIEYKLSVLGDSTGDGDINIADVAKTYQFLKGKTQMDKVYQVAVDVTFDEEILINDVAKLYSYVKRKITTLK